MIAQRQENNCNCKPKIVNLKMVIITLQRAKCIGCNYCVELAPAQYQMSKKDGKAVLLHAKEKKGFFTIKSPDETIYGVNMKAREACPVKIIAVKQI